MSIDANSLDAMVSAMGWLLGLSSALVAGSIFGFTSWWASALRAPSLAVLLGRGVLAFFAIGLLTFGLAAIAIAIEAMAGYPFGPSSGGTVLLAYVTGMRLATFELAVSAVMLTQHSERTDATLSRLLATLTSAFTVVSWYLTTALAFIVAIVMLNMSAFKMGWIPT